MVTFLSAVFSHLAVEGQTNLYALGDSLKRLPV